MPKFAANLTLMFPDVPFPERFARAAKAGFRAVEFLFPYDHPAADVARWHKDNGLENAIFNFPPGDWASGERGLASLPGREDEFRASIPKALEYARAIGARRLHAMAGKLTSAGEAAHHAVYVKNLRLAARELAKHNIALLIEPINRRDMPDYFLTRQDHAEAAIHEIGEPNVRILMDLYHAQIVEGDLSVKLRKNLPLIGHVQMASVPERHEPDEGEVDYRHIFRLIDSLGYDGWIGCEYRPRGRTEDGLGWREALTS